MRSRISKHLAALLLISMPVVAHQQAQQQTQQSQPAGQQPQGPHAKSQKELDALRQVQAAEQASNWDAEIAAINNVLENFADTEYKPMLLNAAMQAAQRKNDYPQTIVWGERVIQNDPKDFSARIMMAATIAQHTRENDLDKEQSLKKIDDYANQGLDLLKTASDTPPVGSSMSATDYAAYKKNEAGLAHMALGKANEVRKKYPEAIAEYKTALSIDPRPDPTTMAYLSQAYIENKQYDDAIATADKILAMTDVSPQVKQFAQVQKDNATKLKGAAAPAAPK
ncbi:MAG: tetratricopeptide repeat protein [Acidobacteriaceae bacterium]|nr:tetratricopeptide repeat protein [Acidobacteriaceae bacterium]MBV9779874.1 tetratricopeptide repeat protein [Acidobacteriaceae bacterium]